MQGSSVLVPPLYRAQAPSKTITVLPFPDDNALVPLTGLLGPLYGVLLLLTPTKQWLESLCGLNIESLEEES